MKLICCISYESPSIGFEESIMVPIMLANRVYLNPVVPHKNQFDALRPEYILALIS
jgi:hypothetical protein